VGSAKRQKESPEKPPSRPVPQAPEREGEDPSVLAARAQRGDVAAFEALYRMNAPRIFALCLRMCGRQERAERLTQDAFVQAWEKLDTFRQEAAFSTWLHQVAINVVLMDRRSRGRRADRRQELEEEDLRGRPAPASHPGLKVDLERAIAALPEGAREVFVLHDVEGFVHREISEQLGIAEGTSKAQLHRARKLLRGMLTS